MPLKNEPQSVKIRFDDPADKANIDAEVARRQMTQQAIFTSLWQRYHTLPNLVQLWFLDQLDAGEDEWAALEALAQHIRRERTKGRKRKGGK